MKIIRWIIVIAVLAVFVGCVVYVLNYYNIIPKQYYSAEDFNIKVVHSSIDFNKNKVDDYTDIMLGARKDAINHPNYKSVYYAGGYPPNNEGVCTDLIWRAFKNAGYSLRDMVDKDIHENVELYFEDEEKPDINIDFRRVRNLKIYFERKAKSLTLDTTKIEKWQPGDIVTFGINHIAIVSDRRNSEGVPYIIHNAGQPVREEDALKKWGISGHFRFDASKLKKSGNLISFNK